jgi:hypothetical protein
MISEVQAYEMAKLTFFNLEGGAAGDWDKLSSDAQEDRVKAIKVMEENLSRINLAILPNGYVKPDGRRSIDRTALEIFIKEWIIARIKKPSGIVNLFPYQQLAYDIVKEFTK